MGQGQEVHARRLMTVSMAEGHWVLLQNCHLGLEYMDELLDTVSKTKGKVKVLKKKLEYETNFNSRCLLKKHGIKLLKALESSFGVGWKVYF